MKKLMLLAVAATALPLAVAAPASAAQQQQPQSKMQPQTQRPAASQNSRMQGNQSAANLSQNQIRQVQQALDQKGFKAGRTDGKLGPETKSALNQFQQKQGLQATGQPDQQTLAALGINGGNSSGASTTGQAPSGQQPPQQSQRPSGLQQQNGKK